jgi:endonuclease V-like protein UPF0215 family
LIEEKIEKEIRIFGVEDGSFEAFNKNKIQFTLLCGVETESNHIKNVKLEKIKVDGLDATDKLLKLLRGLEIDVIILGGATFAGFNIIDPKKIFNETDIPLIIYSGVKPNNKKIFNALRKHFTDWEKRWELLSNLGSVNKIKTLDRESPIYFEVVGCSIEFGAKTLRNSAVISRIPEPVRIAGIIARGLTPIP